MCVEFDLAFACAFQGHTSIPFIELVLQLIKINKEILFLETPRVIYKETCW